MFFDCHADKHPKLNEYVDIKFMHPWVSLLPQQQYQNFVNCYGVLKINNEYYTVSDLIEDNKFMVS